MRMRMPEFKLTGLWPCPAPRAVDAMAQYDRLSPRMQSLVDEFGFNAVLEVTKAGFISSWDDLRVRCSKWV